MDSSLNSRSLPLTLPALMDGGATSFREADLLYFLFSFLLAAALSGLLKRVYLRFGHSLSNRELFGRNFVLISTTTMLIITCVRSSLALSLGLIGALSIVRFRAAIKEPEELSYLFIAIAIGLGIGAQQPYLTLITVIGFCLLVLLIVTRPLLRSLIGSRKLPRHGGTVPWTEHGGNDNHVFLTVASAAPRKLSLSTLAATLQRYASRIALRRFDETEAKMEASFHVEFDNLAEVDRCRADLRSLDEHVKLNFFEDRGVGV